MDAMSEYLQMRMKSKLIVITSVITAYICKQCDFRPEIYRYIRRVCRQKLVLLLNIYCEIFLESKHEPLNIKHGNRFVIHILRKLCQAVTSSQKFLCMSEKKNICRWPGRAHDTWVWHKSPLCKDLPELCHIEGQRIHETFHIIGDSAYPLRTI